MEISAIFMKMREHCKNLIPSKQICKPITQKISLISPMALSNWCHYVVTPLSANYVSVTLAKASHVIQLKKKMCVFSPLTLSEEKRNLISVSVSLRRIEQEL